MVLLQLERALIRNNSSSILYTTLHFTQITLAFKTTLNLHVLARLI